MKKLHGLGRGLDALIDTTHVTTAGSSSISEIALSKIYANPNQPRHTFDEEALDELAVTIACEQISAEQLDMLKHAMREFEESTKTGEVKKIAAYDVQFHDIIYQATHNPKLVNLLNNLREQMYRYRVEYLKDDKIYPVLILEHKRIVEGLSKRDKEKVIAAMRMHVRNQAVAVKEIIRDQE